MATWDGSYSAPDDYYYSDQNLAGPSTTTWQDYPSNGCETHLANGREYYPQAEPIYDYGVDPNLSSVPVNMVLMQNAYHAQQSPNMMAQESTEFFPTSARSAPNAYKTNRPKFFKNNRNHTFFQDQSVSQAADDVDLSGNAQDQASRYYQGPRNRSSGRFLERGRQDRFNNRGSNASKSRAPTYDQPQKDPTQKKFYKQDNRNHGRFQGNRYYNNRQTSSYPQQDVSDASGSQLEGTSGSSYPDMQDPSNYYVQSVDATENVAASRDSESTPNLNRSERQFRDPSSQNSNNRQFQNPLRGNRKFSGNPRQEGYENNYKERKNNYPRYNGNRENYSREYKSDVFVEKDKKTPESEEKLGGGSWRSKKESDEKTNVPKKRQTRKQLDDNASQRERLSDQLNRGILECLVCCENIKQHDYIWSCSNCYHVLHLKCVKKWAKSSQADNGWRCPACQNVTGSLPEEYYCFCGKTKVPEWNRRDVAHSCGETCGRTLSKNNCVHKCTLLCHPGSCPVCIAMVTKNCGCGKTSQTLQCNTHTALLCESICEKELNCGRHKCERKCHEGECGRCEKAVEQVCHCGKNKREVTCDKTVSFTYACDDICNKSLDCGNHNCTQLCHPGDCKPCSLTPDKIMTCCCGQTPLTEERKSCLDPIPTCEKICSKNLRCGQPSNPHKCKVNCHQGDCPDCDLSTDVKCRCGNMDREIECKDLRSKADDARCEKRCTKKRSCGKHKCNQFCCIDIEHVCPLPCSKTLSCGRHKCEQSCHRGRCLPCYRSSFEELYCECGHEVIYPPIPCGTRRPTCNRPCSRQHGCGHEVLHNCHSEPTCPPCTVLTQRHCHGKHHLRKAVPCHLGDISCGLPCGKPISCGRHKCITICHAGPCEKPGQQCTQPCTTPRELCGHICSAACHDGVCPETPCKEIVKVTCQCGNRSMSRPCAENSKEYQRIASNILASKMADMQLGHTVDLEEVFGQGAKKQNQLKTLECNDECKLLERNRRLALGLQIVNPDISGKLMPKYSDFMKQWAKKDPIFCQMVHDKLTELVKLAKTSKQKSRSYSFDTMNREKRHFVHETCEHFGCESQAYDREPKRNIVATAVRDKCWLPSYSLMEIVQRENGQRKVPGPMLNCKSVQSLPSRKSQDRPTGSKVHEADEIDYFDFGG